MPKRVSKIAQEYAGRDVAVGEEFDVEEQHVPLLLSIGRIEPVEGEAGYVAREMTAGKQPEYRTREMKPKKKRFG
jgi:hypothetical protein